MSAFVIQAIALEKTRLPVYCDKLLPERIEKNKRLFVDSWTIAAYRHTMRGSAVLLLGRFSCSLVNKFSERFLIWIFERFDTCWFSYLQTRVITLVTNRMRWFFFPMMIILKWKFLWSLFWKILACTWIKLLFTFVSQQLFLTVHKYLDMQTVH